MLRRVFNSRTLSHIFPETCRQVCRHAVSATSLTAITLNLSFWMIPLFLASITRGVIPSTKVQHVCARAVELIYRRAVEFNSWWVQKVLGVHLEMHGTLPRRDRNLIIVCNHRSWFDILVLHTAVIKHSPIIKFLIKRQLIYVPILGWICLALNFPRLYRTRDPEDRSRDYQAIATATGSLDEYPTALLNFAEGTRFTPDKHKGQQSPWRHLLKPKVGGLRIMLNNADNADVLDVTLVYPREDINFWACLGGALPSVKVYLEHFERGAIKDAEQWLNDRWQVKDRLIAQERNPD